MALLYRELLFPAIIETAAEENRFHGLLSKNSDALFAWRKFIDKSGRLRQPKKNYFNQSRVLLFKSRLDKMRLYQRRLVNP